MCDLVHIQWHLIPQSKLQKETQAKNQQTADAKVSRNFTFRVQQEETSPTKKKKKRVRRPDPEDEEDVDLGKLQHSPKRGT